MGARLCPRRGWGHGMRRRILRLYPRHCAANIPAGRGGGRPASRAGKMQNAEREAMNNRLSCFRNRILCHRPGGCSLRKAQNQEQVKKALALQESSAAPLAQARECLEFAGLNPASSLAQGVHAVLRRRGPLKAEIQGRLRQAPLLRVHGSMIAARGACRAARRIVALFLCATIPAFQTTRAFHDS